MTAANPVTLPLSQYKARHVRLDVAGKVATVSVSIAGSGDVRVHAQQMLDVAIAGAGDVLYRGSPMIRKSIAGSGEVRKAK